MIAVLQEELFRDTTGRELEILTLFTLGREGRHAIRVRGYRTSDNSAINRWLDKLAPRLRAQCRKVLEDGIEAQLELGAQPVIWIVHKETSDWRNAKLSISDALHLLSSPLKLLVENRRNDFNFILAMATPKERERLATAISKGWLEVEHGGGLPEIKHRLKELSDGHLRYTHQWVTRTRMWLLVDRDSDPQDRSLPSALSNEVIALANKLDKPWPVPAHQLARRAIENFLPSSALLIWAKQGRNATEVDRRQRKVAALFRFEPKARFQFNMKKGLLGDIRKRRREDIRATGAMLLDEDLDALFHGLTQEDREILADGFGEELSTIFRRPRNLQGAAFDTEIDRRYRTELTSSILRAL